MRDLSISEKKCYKRSADRKIQDIELVEKAISKGRMEITPYRFLYKTGCFCGSKK